MKLRVAANDLVVSAILEGAKGTFLVLSSSTINRGLLLQNDVRLGSLSFVVVHELTGVISHDRMCGRRELKIFFSTKFKVPKYVQDEFIIYDK